MAREFTQSWRTAVFAAAQIMKALPPHYRRSDEFMGYSVSPSDVTRYCGRYAEAAPIAAGLLDKICGVPEGYDFGDLPKRLDSAIAALQTGSDFQYLRCAASWVIENLANGNCENWFYENTVMRTAANGGRSAPDISSVKIDRTSIDAPEYTSAYRGPRSLPYLCYGRMDTIFAIFDDPTIYPWQLMALAEVGSEEFYGLPWATELMPIQNHFARMSLKFPGKVSFFADEAKAKAGVRTAIKPGRYLTRFYPELTPEQVREWASKADPGQTLCYADTADEIEHVYLNGPRSCMSKPLSAYSSSVHPVRAYESPDLKLAYIKDGDRITARCLVWPEKKQHGRIYGDEIRMRLLLENEGYDLADESPGNYDDLEGARIARILDRGQFVVPYIDGGCGLRDRGDYLELTTSYASICGDNTNGLAGDSEDEPEDEEEEEHYVADLESYHSESWVHDNCSWCRVFDEYNYETERVVFRVRSDGYEYRTDMGRQHLEDCYEWDDTIYYNDVPYTLVQDGDDEVKVPDHRLERDCTYVANDDRWHTDRSLPTPGVIEMTATVIPPAAVVIVDEAA